MTDETALVQARTLARVLDTAVRIPGTNIRFGLDAVLGLVPVLGDTAAAALSGYLVWLASRAGAPKLILARMIGNVVLDTLVGIVPVLGDIFDVAWKSNTRNLALLERYAGAPVATRRASAFFVFIATTVVLFALLGGIAALVLLVRGVIGLIS